MTRASLASGIELEYDTFGSPDDPALLLVMGFTAQMTAWDDDLCRLLAERGRFVVRFDNRDCGLSTKFHGVIVDPAPIMMAALSGQPIPPVPIPYTLSDMAADGIGLMDVLGIERAHAIGASMGGMIVQTMAIEHPERLSSVTSIMSTVGDVSYGQPTTEALGVLLAAPPPDRQAFIDGSVAFATWSSKRYFDAELIKRKAAEAFDRSFYPQGAPRQLAAIFASGDRTEALRRVSVPMLVIHGLDDTLIAPSGGRRTAELVPGAKLLELADMGHDLPEPLWPTLVEAIIAHGHAAELAEAGR